MAEENTTQPPHKSVYEKAVEVMGNAVKDRDTRSSCLPALQELASIVTWGKEEAYSTQSPFYLSDTVCPFSTERHPDLSDFRVLYTEHHHCVACVRLLPFWLPTPSNAGPFSFHPLEPFYDERVYAPSKRYNSKPPAVAVAVGRVSVARTPTKATRAKKASRKSSSSSSPSREKKQGLQFPQSAQSYFIQDNPHLFSQETDGLTPAQQSDLLWRNSTKELKDWYYSREDEARRLYNDALRNLAMAGRPQPGEMVGRVVRITQGTFLHAIGLVAYQAHGGFGIKLKPDVIQTAQVVDEVRYDVVNRNCIVQKRRVEIEPLSEEETKEFVRTSASVFESLRFDTYPNPDAEPISAVAAIAVDVTTVKGVGNERDERGGELSRRSVSMAMEVEGEEKEDRDITVDQDTLRVTIKRRAVERFVDGGGSSRPVKKHQRMKKEEEEEEEGEEVGEEEGEREWSVSRVDMKGLRVTLRRERERKETDRFRVRHINEEKLIATLQRSTETYQNFSVDSNSGDGVVRIRYSNK